MAYDFKKELKQFYGAKTRTEIIQLPSTNYLAVRGKGDPNEEGGAYKLAVTQLYGVAYTLKMSARNNYNMEGFFDYVVPPLEGMWWQEGIQGVDYTRKDQFEWISMLRLPDFVREEDVAWAKEKVTAKKKADFEAVKFFTYDEGECAQILHVGAYDDEPATVQLMNEAIIDLGYLPDFASGRMHHEIYLGDPRKVTSDKLRTIIRHPVKKA